MLTETNKELYDKKYYLSDEIKDYLKKKLKDDELTQTIRNLLDRGYITYQHAKKLLSKEMEEVKSDWSGFINFLEFNLNKDREAVKNSKKNKTEIGLDNQYRKTHEKGIDMSLTESTNQRQAAIGFVFYGGRVLLVRRRPESRWGANKWACVGGKIEEGESPLEAFKREVKEETNLDVVNVKFIGEDNEGKTKIFLYACLCENPHELELNPEHSDYMWCDTKTVKELDTADNIMEFLVKTKNCLVNS